MPGESLVLDAVSEDATNVQFDLVDGISTFLLEHDWPTPELESLYAGSVDTDGDPLVQSRHKNRKIVLKLRVVGSTAAALDTRLAWLSQKVDKVRREGGTLTRTFPSGRVLVADLLAGSKHTRFDKRFIVLFKTEVVLEFEAKPGLRGTPVTLSDHAETTLPCLVFTETGIKGDLPAYGKLVVDEDQAVDQWQLVWGVQSRYYDSAASAALFFEAEGRTPQGGSAIAAGPSGASGSGSNVMRNTGLTTAYQSILSTQAVSAGAHLSHVGDFRVFARCQVPTTNTGTVTVMLEWAEGDFRKRTQNAAVPTYAAGNWILLGLGTVHLSKVVQGTQRWEGRVLAKSTVLGDDLDVDYLMLVPTTEGSGQVSGVYQLETPTAFTNRDEFNQTAGNLNGKTAAVGGAWSGAGDSDDFTVDATAHNATRSTGADADLQTGRYALIGSAVTATLVQVDIAPGGRFTTMLRGVLARYVDTSNWLIAARGASATSDTLEVRKRVAGTVTVLASVPIANLASCTIRLVVDAAGRWGAYVQGSLVASGFDAVLATGGALASGKVGMYDAYTGGGGGGARTYDNFYAAVPTSDAAVFASQSLEVRNDRVIREDSAGTIWTEPSRYEGTYLRVPVAAREGRSARFIVKMIRHPLGIDTGVDDISARLTYTPLWLDASDT